MPTAQPQFTIADLPDTSQYTIKTVCALTGIRAVTLRAWERRYHVLRPQRTGGNYRLYSERDVAILRWLKSRVDGGLAGRLRREQQDKLVAAQPGEHIDVPQDSTDARTDLLQQVVAVTVAECVVDVLEAVEVEQDHRDRALRLAGLCKRTVEQRGEERAVGQPGQLVVSRLIRVQIGLRAVHLGRLPAQSAEQQNQHRADSDRQ